MTAKEIDLQTGIESRCLGSDRWSRVIYRALNLSRSRLAVNSRWHGRYGPGCHENASLPSRHCEPNRWERKAWQSDKGAARPHVVARSAATWRSGRHSLLPSSEATFSLFMASAASGHGRLFGHSMLVIGAFLGFGVSRLRWVAESWVGLVKTCCLFF